MGAVRFAPIVSARSGEDLAFGDSSPPDRSQGPALSFDRVVDESAGRGGTDPGFGSPHASAAYNRRVPLAVALPQPPWTTRFAPAPTGFLHLGHAANAVFVWGLAAAGGGRVELRVEDHDRGRCRADYELALLEDLTWLGLEPAGGLAAWCDVAAGTPQQWRQSDHPERYRAALDQLVAANLVYPCRCSRRDITRRGPVDAHAAAPPTDGATASEGVEHPYPGICRDAQVSPTLAAARRLRLDANREVHFADLLLGPQSQRPAKQCGDFLLVDRNNCYTYQFSVVVDDLAQGVDVVIRGADLLASTGRQIVLAQLLGRATPPRFLHHPLLLRPDGSKLSKSNRDTGIGDLRAAGWSPERVLGEASWLAGLLPTPSPLAADELAGLFAVRSL